MPRADSRHLRWLAFFITVPVVVVADQITKAWIRGYPVGSVIFKEGFFRIVHIENSGAAFGLFQGHSTALMIIDFFAIGAILAYFAYLHARFPLFQSLFGWVGMSLICAGASGNLIDRINPNVSGITDFVYVWIWPAFNVADSAIVVGTIVLAASILFGAERSRKPT